MGAELRDIKENEERLEASIQSLRQAAAPKAYFINEDSGRWHKRRDDNLDGLPALWSAVCGCKCAKANFARARMTPEGLHSSKHSGRCLSYDKTEVRLKEAAQAASRGSLGSECSAG